MLAVLNQNLNKQGSGCRVGVTSPWLPERTCSLSKAQLVEAMHILW